VNFFASVCHSKVRSEWPSLCIIVPFLPRWFVAIQKQLVQCSGVLVLDVRPPSMYRRSNLSQSAARANASMQPHAQVTLVDPFTANLVPVCVFFALSDTNKLDRTAAAAAAGIASAEAI